MDRRLVGKWYKKEMGETLNIFNEMPLRMKMSFSSSGHYNFEPNCIYEKDGYFCYEINDDRYRMVYYIKVENEELVGFYTQFGKETPIKYVKISDVPDDEPYQFVPTEIYVPETKESRLDILKKHSEYSNEILADDYKTEYVLGEEIPEILHKYNYFDYMRDIKSGTDEVAFKLLDFICDNFMHNGSGGTGGKSIEELVDFCEKHEMKTNCRGLAILLATLLRMNNIKARHITCKPYEEPFQDCHVVVDCLLPSGKRIMLDPTNRLYYTDSSGEYVSLERLRQLLILDEPIYHNAGAAYNKGKFDDKFNRNYMIKNTFRFVRGTFYNNGAEDNTVKRVELIPKGYDTQKFNDERKKQFIYNDTAFWEM